MLRLTRSGLCSLALGALAALSPSAAFADEPAPFVREWSHYTFGGSIGRVAFESADLDGDALEELVFTSVALGCCNGDRWSVLAFQPATGIHTIRWQSPPDTRNIRSLRVLDDGNGAHRILVGYTGLIEVFDGLSLQRTASIPLANRAILQVERADADNDGRAELVVLTSTATYLLDAATYALELELPYGGERMGIGNVDDDASLEIAWSSGWVVQRRLGVTQVDWDYSEAGFGRDLVLADTDADPALEIVAGDGFSVSAFDGRRHRRQWQHEEYYGTGPLHLADVAGDGRPEILFPGGQWQGLRALAADTGTGVWALETAESGKTRLHVFDADGDGDDDVAFGVGDGTTAPDYLHIHEVTTGERRWSSVETASGPYFNGIAWGDVDGDGGSELVLASANSSMYLTDGIITVHDAATGAQEWRTTPATLGAPASGILDVAIADLDGDGASEIVASGANQSARGALHIIDGRTRALRGTYLFRESNPLAQVAAADLDGDGDVEIVTGTSFGSSGATAEFVTIVNPVSGRPSWASADLGRLNSVSALEIGNVDADPAPEIVVIAKYFHAWDGVTHAHVAGTDASLLGVALADGDADGVAEVYASTSNGRLQRIDPATGQATSLGTLCPTEVMALAALEGARLGFTCGASAGTFDLASGSVSWMSAPLDARLRRLSATPAALVEDGSYRFATGGETSVITFADAALPSLQFARPLQRIGESAGAAAVRLTLSQPQARDLVVPLEALSGTATPGEDLVLPASVTLPAGRTHLDFTIAALPDSLDEARESLRLRAASPQPGVLPAAPMILAIEDDDDVPAVSLRRPADVTEGEPARFEVALAVASGRDVRVRYRLDGTARPSEDYAVAAGELIIPAGRTRALVTIATIGDAAPEPAETLALTLTRAYGGRLDGELRRVVTIADDD